MSDQGKLILITDIIEQKVRKEKELEFYLRELEKLNSKISYLRTEVDLTNTIIGMIKGEMVYDIKEQMIENTELIADTQKDKS
jgi:predicted ATP-grasp superfamily ATP-dependent carboligase